MATKKTSPKAEKSTVARAKPKAATTENVSADTSSFKSRVSRHKLAIIFVALILIGAGYLIYTHISVVVAATVNGQPIYRYKLLTTTEQVYGPEVLEKLINEQVVAQEAQKRGIVITQEDLDKEFQDLKDQYKQQGVDIESVMQQSGVSKEEVQKNLQAAALQNKVVLSEGIVVTDDEVTLFFEKNKSLLPEDPAEMEATKKNVQMSLRNQKIQEFLQKLRTRAKVNYYIGQ